MTNSQSSLAGIDVGVILREVHSLVGSVKKSLAFCKNEEVELPPELILEGQKTNDPNDPALVQFKNSMLWEVPGADPDPGQDVAIGKYIPVDFLQVNPVQENCFTV